MDYPPPLLPAPSGLAATTPPQGGSHWRQDGNDYRKSLAMTPSGKSLEKSTPRASRRNSTRAGFQSFKTIKNHSPFEGNIQLAEDDEQGWFKAIKITPPLRGSRRNKGEARRRAGGGTAPPHALNRRSTPPQPPARTPKAASGTAGAAGVPDLVANGVWGLQRLAEAGTRTTPHRCRRRRAAWRNDSPSRGGVIGGRTALTIASPWQ